MTYVKTSAHILHVWERGAGLMMLEWHTHKASRAAGQEELSQGKTGQQCQSGGQSLKEASYHI